LIPKSNPFLRKLFGYVAGPDIDDRIRTTVDNLADVFRATNVDALLHNFGKSTQTNDPIIHFYETFLAEYDPKLRKSRGVWYTPEPVVNFIVRAVDDILKTEFGLSQGLADTSKTKIKVPNPGGKGMITKEVHKVQILDPATGTGTFLAEVIKHIYNKNFKSMQGVWSSYVENDLIPRLNGFELLMASYSMAHLKLDMLLTETGYKPTRDQRLNVYLTNSLEEHHQDTGTLFANWLSSEANEANHIKRDTPVMCVIGNPPYAVSSRNKGDWIQNLLKDYKKDLNERKINIDDDYIKFIRYGQYYIEKNGEGILAYISNNSFIDGITHRQMRKHLLASFDKIYIIDLHGSAKKNETTSEGAKDENVFDIQQGVSINIFVKTSNRKKNAIVHHLDIFGLREFKYKTLVNSSISSLSWERLDYKEPYYFFVPKDFKSYDVYNKYFSINDLFVTSNSGIKTDRDKLFIDISRENTKEKFKILLSEEISPSFVEKFRVVDSGSYKITNKIKGVLYNENFIKSILYRPFDLRYTYYDPRIVSRPAEKVTHHIMKGSLALVSCRQQSTFDFQHIIVSKYLTEVCTVSLQTKETGYAFPLYLYPDSEDELENQERTPNFNLEIVDQLAKKIDLAFTNEKEETKNTFAPIDILDYIYAVLHSPSYREKYKEFLKIDFPRVPFPKDKDTFWKLVKLGGEIRQIHLLESAKVEEFITSYPQSGDNVVVKPKYIEGKVYINDEQYFDSVPEIAWNFYIGGYQPAQKWLKDRKGRELSYEDIKHYQKIIVALTETDRIMKEIDKTEVE
ncbi:MAG: N-6 DNA methylase, partial [Candidatus Delongbacteria bacterium]|nr:N-6 DNA methylase [Candidatus Delongbacteria bacterium]